MSIPKDTICRHCGKRILFVPSKVGGKFPIDAQLAGYRRQREDERQGDAFYTNQGGLIRGFAEEERPDGYAHRPHYLSCARRR